MKHNDPR